jgi:hypothetical protein
MPMKPFNDRALAAFLKKAAPGLCPAIVDALDEQEPAVRDRLWRAIDAGDLSFLILEDGRIEFRAGGEAFLRLTCVSVTAVPAAMDRTH